MTLPQAKAIYDSIRKVRRSDADKLEAIRLVCENGQCTDREVITWLLERVKDGK